MSLDRRHGMDNLLGQLEQDDDKAPKVSRPARVVATQKLHLVTG